MGPRSPGRLRAPDPGRCAAHARPGRTGRYPSAEGAEKEPEIADAAAAVLHNTRTVARNSYVHPVVFDAEDDQVAQVWGASRRSKWYNVPTFQMELSCEWEIEHGMEWVVRGDDVAFVGGCQFGDPFQRYEKLYNFVHPQK